MSPLDPIDLGRIALLSLAAAAFGGLEGFARVRFGSGVKTFEQAAEALAREGRLRECDATVVEETLTIECRDPSQDALSLSGYLKDAVANHETPLGAALDLCRRTGSSLLIVAGSRSLRTSVSMLEAWAMVFVTTMPLSISTVDPTVTQRASGIGCVVRFGRASDV